MNESISYSFLLNIIILFVFVCGAIVTGVFSYYRAVKANTLIVNEIEKYEGYNCLSQQSIEKKLSSVSYNAPFAARCSSRYGDLNQCMIDPVSQNYAVYSYNNEGLSDNLGIGSYAFDDNFNSKVKCDDSGKCLHTTEYQYGVVTYMYVDLPVVSSLLKLSYFSKTREMHEFRDLVKTQVGFEKTDKNTGSKYFKYRDVTLDYNYLPTDVSIMQEADGIDGPDADTKFQMFGPVTIYANRVLNNTLQKYVNEDVFVFGYDPSIYGNGMRPSSVYNMRDAYRYYRTTQVEAQEFFKSGRYGCGYEFDWSVY